jgi:SAM-dependent methyltransferase
LFRLWSHGFKLSNIRGLDLISYSPYIDLGDMHSLPYMDGSFDIVLCGWTLAYSENRPRVGSEIVRVLRQDGVAAIGVQVLNMTDEQIFKMCGYQVGSRTRISTVEEILSYFEGHVEHVYFNHGIVKGVNSQSGSLIVIFSVKK